MAYREYDALVVLESGVKAEFQRVTTTDVREGVLVLKCADEQVAYFRAWSTCALKLTVEAT